MIILFAQSLKYGEAQLYFCKVCIPQNLGWMAYAFLAIPLPSGLTMFADIRDFFSEGLCFNFTWSAGFRRNHWEIGDSGLKIMVFLAN